MDDLDGDKPPPRAPRARRRHLAGFAMAGLAGFAVDAGVLTAGVALGLAPGPARVPSFLAAAVTTWLLNRTLTFRTSTPPNLREFVRFVGAMSLGLGINYVVFLVVLQASEAARATPALALVPAVAAGMIANFVNSRRLLDR